jgi:putative ABC transport system permease protein
VFVLARREQADRDLLDEVQHFFDEQVNELMESGMSAAEARRVTRLRLGEPGSVREDVRAAGWETVPGTVLQDVRYGVRVLRRSPLFTTVAIITLALGVGATTAVFSAVRGVLLRPLPYPDADRLVVPRSRDVTNGDEWTVSYADYETWTSAGVFGAVGVYREVEANASGVEAPERVDAVQVSAGFMEALGVEPQQGRTFGAVDYEATGVRPIVISRSSTACSTLDVAVLRPMPSPSVQIATSANDRFRTSARTALRTSWWNASRRPLRRDRLTPTSPS